MLVVNRFRVADEPGFVERAHTALAALSACAGFDRARLGRSADDPALWCLVTEWRSVGAYRRALSAYDVKLHATPLLAESLEEPSAYEVLADADGDTITVAASDRAEP
ncbi:MAG: antibiotic biosynthesis monooxygenase [Micromonosporaceae bacterium]|nr:antibiotic biosynthesis monooxygenase [Micromonosporaceae bacterium]